MNYFNKQTKRFNNSKRAEERDRVKHTGIKEVIKAEQKNAA